MQAHFAQLNDRDEAMSRSLNSDYLDQLLIKADTSRLDGDLVRLAAEERPVPEEEQALLVFKRGYASQPHPSRLPDVCMLVGTHLLLSRHAGTAGFCWLLLAPKKEERPGPT